MRRGPLITALLLAATATAVASPAPAPAAESDPAFCMRTVVRDYLAPAVRFWPAPFPQLPFGPPGIRIDEAPNLLVGSGGRVGFSLLLTPGSRAAHPRWKVKTTLYLVRFPPHTHSQLFVHLRSAERRVRTVSPNNSPRFFFRVPDEHAYYAVDAHFKSLSDRPLGSYRFYFRVVRPIRNARLALEASAYRPGETVLGRIENYGTLTALYGAAYRIERFDGTSWSLAPETPDVFTLPLYGAPAGETGDECSPFTIPPTMALGRYRMTKPVHYAPSMPAARDQPIVTLTAEFDVLASE